MEGENESKNESERSNNINLLIAFAMVVALLCVFCMLTLIEMQIQL